MPYDEQEKAAKDAYNAAQKIESYAFEFSELAGYINNGILEAVYKQAFFAGVNWQRQNINLTKKGQKSTI